MVLAWSRRATCCFAFALAAACAHPPPPALPAVEATGPFTAQKASTSVKPIVPRGDEAPPLWFATPRGWKPYQLVSISGTEALNRPYHLLAQIQVDDPSIDVPALLGSLVTAGVRTASGTSYFSGYVNEVSGAPPRTQLSGVDAIVSRKNRWNLTLVPWTSLLSRRADCAVYAQGNVPSVLTQFFDQKPFSAYRMALGSGYPRAPFFVQYRETDLNFVQRLVENVGILTYFEHGPTGHDLVLVDDVQRLGANLPSAVLTPETVSNVDLSTKQTVTRYALRASAPGAAYAATTGNATDGRPASPIPLEMYDFEGTAANQRDIDFYTRLRVEEQAGSATRFHAIVRERILRPGSLLNLIPLGVPSRTPYVVISADVHAASVGDGGGIDTDGTGVDVQTMLEAVPATGPYRPERRTSVPIVSGSQVARVVDRVPDDRSRVKVRFQWARGNFAQNDVWLPLTRAALATNGDVPRPGTDVLVDFLEGDPERPIVVGVVSR